MTLTIIYAEPLNIDGLLDIEDISKTTGNMVVKGLSKGFRQITNTRTAKEECNRAWWKYFKKSNRTISILAKDNIEIEQVLYKRNINHKLSPLTSLLINSHIISLAYSYNLNRNNLF